MIWLKTNLQYRGDGTNTHTHTHVTVHISVAVSGGAQLHSVNYLCFMTDGHPLSKHLNFAPIKYCCRLCQKKRPPPLLKLPCFYPLSLFLSRLLQTTRHRLVFCSFPVFEPFLMPQSTSLRLFFHCHRFTLVKPYNGL